MQSTRIAEAPMHSRARPTRVAAVALLTAWLAACGHDTLPTTVPADDMGYRALGVQDEAALGVTASGLMAEIGCRPLRGSPDSSTIALRLVPPRVNAYQCRDVPTARIRAAVRAVRQMVLTNPRWASVQSEAGDGGGGSGYYAYDHMECIWHPAAPPEYGERINADGDFEVYVLVEARLGRCSWMAIFRYVAPGGGSGSPAGDPGGAPGAPQPDQSPPVDSLHHFIASFELPEAASAEDTLPNCTLAQPHPGRRDWCSARIPAAGAELDRINAAIQRMRAIGGECAVMAAALDGAVAAGWVRVSSQITYSGWAGGRPGESTPILIHENFVTRWYSDSRKAIYDDLYLTLQLILAHEMDHAMGDQTHIDPPRNLLTRRSLQCSDVPNQKGF